MTTPIYLDCNASTPIEPEVCVVVYEAMMQAGNPSSRTHSHGRKAREKIEETRELLAEMLNAEPWEVFFTSGATESNNLAILGMAEAGKRLGRIHLVVSAIEHASVLEPVTQLKEQGFEVTYVNCQSDGYVEPDTLLDALRDDTLLVSLMEVNNETGVVQSIEEVARRLKGHAAFFHVDAAQGFGKGPTDYSGVDLLSLTAHKIYGPVGVGALMVREHLLEYLQPRSFGGGQEESLRPGTLSMPLIAGFGKALSLCQLSKEREAACLAFREKAFLALSDMGAIFNVPLERSLPNTFNLRFPGLDSEVVMMTLSNRISISNGSACHSGGSKSHVLEAMGLSAMALQESLRISWCHMTPELDWIKIKVLLEELRK